MITNTDTTYCPSFLLFYKDTKKGQTRVDIVNDEIVLVDTGIKLNKEEQRLY